MVPSQCLAEPPLREALAHSSLAVTGSWLKRVPLTTDVRSVTGSA